MIRHPGIDAVRPDLFIAPVVTVGVFDGVHLGHRSVLQQTIDWARQVAGNSVVVTFDQHPQAVLQGKKPLFIASLEHRLREFQLIGIDHAIILSFDATLAAIPAERFLRETLLGAIGSQRILLGHNAAFGQGGRGNYTFLKPFTQTDGFELRQAEPVLLEGRAISSTVIRAEILRGELDTAAQMLGRPISVLGTVTRGSGRGKALGYPTANLDLHHELRPPAGVYITTVRIGDRLFRSITNIGVRPTFASEYEADKGRERVETHILGLDEDLYGQDIEVSFVAKIREEKRFDSKEALIAQIARDLDELNGRLHKTP